MPSPGPGGSQSSLAGAVAWLTSQFRARPKPQPKEGRADRILYRRRTVGRRRLSRHMTRRPDRSVSRRCRDQDRDWARCE